MFESKTSKYQKGYEPIYTSRAFFWLLGPLLWNVAYVRVCKVPTCLRGHSASLRETVCKDCAYAILPRTCPCTTDLANHRLAYLAMVLTVLCSLETPTWPCLSTFWNCVSARDLQLGTWPGPTHACADPTPRDSLRPSNGGSIAKATQRTDRRTSLLVHPEAIRLI